MSRQLVPFIADDMSALARALKGELERAEKPPGHVELLNMLARAGGYRNFQHLRAQADAQGRLENPEPAPAAPPVDFVKVERIARFFDADGQLVRWPGKASERGPCLWVLWSRLPARTPLAEAEINRALAAWHRFGDHALLRRELVDTGLVARTADGREYRRIEQAPPAEAQALIRHLGRRLVP